MRAAFARQRGSEPAPPPPVVLHLRNLNQYPTGPRPYLRVAWPHCLLPEGTIRSERYRFASMEHVLDHWAFLLFQAVERMALSEAASDAAQLARGRQDAAEDAEMVWQIAAEIGLSEVAAAALVSRSVIAGRAIAASALRGEPAHSADFYPWYAMP